MSKRIKALFMALLMVVSTVLSSASNLQMAYADSGITVRFHYQRTDGDYADWNMWIWASGKDGTANEFTGEDDFGKYLDYAVDAGTAEVGFIVRLSEWLEKDVESDRFVDVSDVISGVVDVYIKTGVAEFETDKSAAVVGCKVKSATATDRTTLAVELTAEPEVDVETAFAVKNVVTGEDVAIESVEKNDLTVTIKLSEEIDYTKAYTISFDGNDYDIVLPDYYSTEEFEDAYTYDGDDLGATWSAESTLFKVWAPTATEVKLNLYEGGKKGEDDLIDSIDMELGDKGVWEVTVEDDLNGVYYTYSATVNGTVNETIDPYARTSGVNGDRGMVIDLDSTDPEGWDEDERPFKGTYTDAVIYELHVRDFSYDASSGMANTGKYLAFTELGTTNSEGLSTGVDYIKDLGITHIHLLPTYDQATLKEDKLDVDQFNWGYDPKNYNVPEGSYSTDPYNGEVRVNEYKQMVQSLHANGIAVIADVVYNHTYSASDFSVNLLVPGYFHRPDSNGSGCGNDVASERAMVKKYIVDSCIYWIEEYHLDGMRFDLVGLIDTDTINEIVEELHAIDPSIVLYGEGWSIGTKVTKPDVDLATQGNAALTPGFGYFADAMRDNVKGSVFGATEPGYVNGNPSKAGALLMDIAGAPIWAMNPTQAINYVSCHDNYTLFDKLQSTCPDATMEELVAMNSLSAAMVITSQGVPFFQAGEEILRTKEKEDGTFDHNSYASSSELNCIKWDDLNKAEYKASYEYYKGLIEFRKNHAAMRMDTMDEVNEYMNIFMKGDDAQNVLAYELSGEAEGEVADGIIVVFNPSADVAEVTLPEGEWQVCVNKEAAGTEVLSTATGSVEVDGVSCMVLVKGATKMSDEDADDNNGGDSAGDDVTDDDPTDETTKADETEAATTTASNASPSTGDSPISMVVFVVLALAIVSVLTSVVVGKKTN